MQLKIVLPRLGPPLHTILKLMFESAMAAMCNYQDLCARKRSLESPREQPVIAPSVRAPPVASSTKTNLARYAGQWTASHAIQSQLPVLVRETSGTDERFELFPALQLRPKTQVRQRLSQDKTLSSASSVVSAAVITPVPTFPR